MPFVERNAAGAIVAVSATPGPAAAEELPAGHPELLRFVSGGGARAELSVSDLELVRVIEDLVGLLIDKQVIMLTELPPAAQRKFARRRDLRGKLGDLSGIVAEAEETNLP
jgi:hypothetical protein